MTKRIRIRLQSRCFHLKVAQCLTLHVKFADNIRRNPAEQMFWRNLRPNFHRRLKVIFAILVSTNSHVEDVYRPIRASVIGLKYGC